MLGSIIEVILVQEGSIEKPRGQKYSRQQNKARDEGSSIQSYQFQIEKWQEDWYLRIARGYRWDW